MALQQVPNYSINVPDPGAAFAQGMAYRQQYQAQQAARAEAEAIKQDVQALGPNPTVASITALITKYPQLADRFKAQLSLLSQQERDARQAQAVPIYAALMNNKPETAIGLLQQQADALRTAGNEAAAKAAETQIAFIKADPLSAKTAFGVSMAALMGPDKFSETYNSLETNIREQQLLPAKLAEAEAKALAAARSEGVEVQSSQILPNGVTVIIAKDGTRQVRDVNGNVVMGVDAALAIENAQQAGIRYKGEEAGAQERARRGVEAETAPVIAGGRAAGEAGIKAGAEAFTALTRLSGSISNLKRASELAKGGANTGVIASRLPNWTASSIELNNLRNQLGLDVIGGATFGALSEGELALALNTALPTNLDQKDLADWIDRKIAAQEKMRKELQKVALFLSKPGNTIEMWLSKNGIEPAPAARAPGTIEVNY